LLCVGFAVGLFAGFERQWFGKLNGDASYEAVQVIDRKGGQWPLVFLGAL